VAADLRRRIAADEWAADEALPTTVALAEHYRVSQSTITRVLRILAADGLVRTVPRWGTFRT
jgi:DNA-binding GntR family transcriptional regulator